MEPIPFFQWGPDHWLIRAAGNKDRRNLIYSVLLGLLLALFTIGPLVKSGFSIIDDHERVGWLGSTDRLTLDRIVPVLSGTELGEIFKTCSNSPCKIGRFRPIYYSEMVLETWLFGDWTAGCFALRVLFFAGLLAAIGWAAMSALGPIVGSGMMIFVASMRFWEGIWAWSLGTSEAVAVPGFALAVTGVVGLVRGWSSAPPRRLDGAFSRLAIGAAIAFGAKENFAFLWGLTMLILIAALWQRRLGWLGIIVGVGALVFGGLVFGGTLITLATAGRNGADVYGMTVADRLHHFWRRGPVIWPDLVVLAGLALVGVGRRHEHGIGKQLCMAGIVATICGCYAVWESFFYGGLPKDGRYAFPSALIQPFALGLLFYAIPRLNALGKGGPARFLPASRPSVAIIGTLLFLVWPGHYWAFPIRAYVAKRVEQSIQLENDLSASAAIAAAHPDWPILVEAGKPFDYEPAYTLNLWLVRAGIKNPRFLIVNPAIDPAEHDFQGSLIARMQDWSVAGLDGKFSPRSKLDRLAVMDGMCFRLAIRVPTAGSCVALPFRPASYVG